MKTYKIAIITCSALLALAIVVKIPAADTGLTTNSVYQKNCEKCHGKTAEGRHFGGPALVSEKTAAMSGDDLRKMIADGKGRMPKFAGKLTGDEIDKLVQQIQAANKK